MKRMHIATAVLLALPAMAQAITVDTTFSYAKNGTGLYGLGAVGFNKSATLDVGVATLGFGASASTGSVDASATAQVQATFDNSIALSAATNATVDVSLNNLSYGFDTLMGARAYASVDFKPIHVTVPLAPDINIDPAPFDIIGANYALSASNSRSGGLGTSTTGTDSLPVAGDGVPSIPGITPVAQVTLDARQSSTLTMNDLVGVIRATHVGDGAVVFDSFSLLSDPLASLNLGLAGDWNLDYMGVMLDNTFKSTFGLGATATIGFSVGLGCGDPSTNSDNGIACIYDAGASASSPTLNLLSANPFAIDWGSKTASLGTINVYDDSVATVPLPAGLVLLLTGLGGLAGLGRTSRRRTA